jgi:hypothetical protein
LVDYITQLRIGAEPASGVSGAVVVASELSTFLMFNSADGAVVLVELIRAIKSQFGYPNDEALGGHPLYQSGLKHYGVFEVENSSWLEQTRKQNAVCFPNADRWGKNLHHFVFTFHDSTFECLAEDLKVRSLGIPKQQVLADLLKHVSGD